MVFVVFFSGEQARNKILKICEAFGANCYPVPDDVTKQRQITREVMWFIKSCKIRWCSYVLNLVLLLGPSCHF